LIEFNSVELCALLGEKSLGSSTVWTIRLAEYRCNEDMLASDIKAKGYIYGGYIPTAFSSMIFWALTLAADMSVGVFLEDVDPIKRCGVVRKVVDVKTRRMIVMLGNVVELIKWPLEELLIVLSSFNLRGELWSISNGQRRGFSGDRSDGRV
jgi:hypothetical protein